MADIIANQLNRMQSDIDTFQKSLANYKQKCENMYGSLAVLNGYWEGPAHDTFVSKVASDKEVMGEIIKSLESYHAELTNALESYKQCESKVSGLIDAMKI